MTYILSHDLGTTGNKATLFSESGSVTASQFCPYPTVYPQPGQAEQNAGDYWRAFCTATSELVSTSGINSKDIAVVSFSAQMMAALPIGNDGEPLRPAIIWSDMRSSAQTSRIAEDIGEEEVYRITGHRLSPSYSAAKIMWIRDHEPDIYRNASKFLQVKDYIIYRLTGHAVTDYSDATGTNLFDVTSMEWSDAMLHASGIAAEKLPEPILGSAVVGTVTQDAAGASGLKEGTAVVAGGGDGACATYGSGVLDDSEAYLCLGTSSWMATAVEGPVIDEQMRIGNYALFEAGKFMPTGSMNAGGGALKWFIDSVLQGEERIDYDELIGQAMAAVPGVQGLLFLPYLMGERSPPLGSYCPGNIHRSLDVPRPQRDGPGSAGRGFLSHQINSGSVSGEPDRSVSCTDYWRRGQQHSLEFDNRGHSGKKDSPSQCG